MLCKNHKGKGRKKIKFYSRGPRGKGEERGGEGSKERRTERREEKEEGRKDWGREGKGREERRREEGEGRKKREKEGLSVIWYILLDMNHSVRAMFNILKLINSFNSENWRRFYGRGIIPFYRRRSWRSKRSQDFPSPSWELVNSWHYCHHPIFRVARFFPR